MDSLVFLVFWIIVAFFITRFIARRYLPDPRQAEVTAVGVAMLCAVGAWYYGAHFRSAPSPTAPHRGAPGKSLGIRDTTAACRLIGGPFAETPSGSIDLVRSLEQSGATSTVPDGGAMNRLQRYVVEGWAAEPSLDFPASGVCLLLDGKIDAHHKVIYGVPRPDVARGFHRDALLGSGYRIEIAPGSIVAGKHHFQVVSLSGGLVLGIVPDERNITVY
jgi:hypothetical protein